MGTDAVTLIENDHRLLESLFQQLQAGEGDRRALVDEVAARLTAHAKAEEEEVYPAITKADPGEADEVEHAYHEHDEAVHLLLKVVNLVESPHFEQALGELVEGVRHHVEEEETEVLPALRDAVDGKTLESLGEAFSRVRADALREAGFAEEPAPAPSTSSPTDELEEATRDELYDMAKEADIPGRSNMNKEQLTDALREQG
jgi:hemerythrin-like domain-containing protein